MDKIELKKSNGDVFFTAQRGVDNTYIQVDWIGIQSLETIMYGANQLLAMMQKLSCPVILNINRELIGPWEEGAQYLGTSWAPKAKFLGVKKFLHVLAPGIYGKRSFHKFKNLAQQYFPITEFELEEEAKLQFKYNEGKI